MSALAQVLFRHQRKMLVVFALSLAVGGGILWLVPPAWRAEATLLVEAGRPDGARALAAMLESRDLHAQVLAAYGDTLYPRVPAQARADAFAHDLKVIPTDGAGLVRLSLDGPDGAVAAKALSVLLDRLAEKNRTVFAVQPDSQATRQAAEAREALAAFRKRSGLGEGSLDRSTLTRRRTELDAEVNAAEAEAGALSDRLAALKARLAAVPATIEISAESERSKVAEEARSKLFELQAKEAELLAKYQEGSVFVQNLRAEKRKVEEMLGKLDTATQNKVVNGANPVHQELEKEAFRAEAALSAAQARAKAATKQMAELNRKLDTLSGSERQLADLERAVAVAEARLGPAKAIGAAIDGIGVVQQATPGSRPVGPTPPMLMGMAAAIGALLALLVAGLTHALSSRLSSPADVERRLGLPVLTTIPRES
ncbi:MAG TPA: hypothetical protein VL974_00505, partial [Magnetospirillum sp.]|jgi:uncharacterized protein involved in exopolysaccharide biosynthesis|nr:hypothetical protein [Magnetospirillum sp.]